MKTSNLDLRRTTAFSFPTLEILRMQSSVTQSTHSTLYGGWERGRNHEEQNVPALETEVVVVEFKKCVVTYLSSDGGVM